MSTPQNRLPTRHFLHTTSDNRRYALLYWSNGLPSSARRTDRYGRVRPGRRCRSTAARIVRSFPMPPCQPAQMGRHAQPRVRAQRLDACSLRASPSARLNATPPTPGRPYPWSLPTSPTRSEPDATLRHPGGARERPPPCPRNVSSADTGQQPRIRAERRIPRVRNYCRLS